MKHLFGFSRKKKKYVWYLTKWNDTIIRSLFFSRNTYKYLENNNNKIRKKWMIVNVTKLFFSLCNLSKEIMKINKHSVFLHFEEHFLSSILGIYKCTLVENLGWIMGFFSKKSERRSTYTILVFYRIWIKKVFENFPSGPVLYPSNYLSPSLRFPSSFSSLFLFTTLHFRGSIFE